MKNIEELEKEVSFYKSKFQEFSKITVALSKEKNIGKLLTEIVYFGRKFTSCEAGTLYKFDEDSLSFNVIQNEVLGINLNSEFDETNWPSIPVNDGNSNLVSVYCAIHKRIINVPDVYSNHQYNFDGTKEFDKKNNYKTSSVLVVPVLNPENDKLLGILQLINKKDTNDKIIPFQDEDIELIEALASQSAVVLERLEGELQYLRKLTKRLEKQKTQLAYLANTDQLTQISNRLKFNTLLNIELSQAHEMNTPLSFIIFDIDKFKSVNDTYGHQIGDYVLVEIAKVVKKSLEPDTIFARWGGEEFVILLPNTDKQGALSVAEMLRENIESHCFEEVKKITSSFGVTELNPNDDKEALIAKADEALYSSKENGRNMVTFY